jgi:TldD protein
LRPHIAQILRYACCWCAFSAGFAQTPIHAAGLTSILQAELDRNFKALSKADPPPYFMSYEVDEQEGDSLSASLGALVTQSHAHLRAADTTVRVGSDKFDNYHPYKGSSGSFTTAVQLSLDDNPNQIQRTLWLETDRVYRSAVRRLLQLKTDQQLLAEQDAVAADFSVEKPEVYSKPPERYQFDTKGWADRLRALSKEFIQHPDILSSQVGVAGHREVKTLVNTEGAAVEHGTSLYRFEVSASALAPDGMDLRTFSSFEASAPDRLPSDADLRAAVKKVADQLSALVKAPVAEPVVCPAILSGNAAAVFFHEIFGHRVEGHRQKDIAEGQTFTKMLGQPVLPPFLSVTFDPTRHSMQGVDLNGYYEFDDEGVRARPVNVVEDGILKTFLLSRSPVGDFQHSNGHGRRQAGLEVVSRQSNLLVISTKQVTDKQLREQLIAEVKRQNKPYGLYFEQVSSGYTTTRRQGLQAFTVVPLVVYKVYPDGRPDELIRGVDIVGTPLASFRKILATSDRLEVFNGYCGAESGSVPVSAISPAILVSEIEIEKKQNSQQRPPLLPRPGTLVAATP